MIENQATIKMIQNIIDGTTPLKIAAIRDIVFPVGTILYRSNSTSPASDIGGTWKRIAQGQFIIGVGSSYSLNSTGGEATHTLSESEMPKHRHNEHWLDYNDSEANIGYGSGNTGGLNISDLRRSWGGGMANVVQTWYAGDSEAHNNMPPYVAKYVWERTA